MISLIGQSGFDNHGIRWIDLIRRNMRIHFGFLDTWFFGLVGWDGDFLWL